VFLVIAPARAEHHAKNLQCVFRKIRSTVNSVISVLLAFLYGSWFIALHTGKKAILPGGPDRCFGCSRHRERKQKSPAPVYRSNFYRDIRISDFRRIAVLRKSLFI
jgi:hypothetical protein